MIRILMLLIALAAGSANAAECNVYALQEDPDATVTVGMNSVTVKDEAGRVAEYPVIISKSFGKLVSAAFDTTGEYPIEHRFSFLELKGEKALIYDSQVFFPACSIAK